MLSPDAPIQRKLMTMILATSGVVLLLTCAAFIGYEFATYRQTSIRQLSTLGEVIASESTGAMAFDNQTDATEILSALRADRHVVAACLFDKTGRLFARYPANAASDLFPSTPPPDGYHFADGFLVSSTPVIQMRANERFGTLYLRSDMQAINERLRLYTGIAMLVILVSSLVAYFLSRTLQRQISRPIQDLAETARAVSDRRDYSVRANRHGDDELGLLTDAFNHMLAQIQEQNTQLENRVRARTAELESANNELEAFCSSAAHDLRTPLRAITGFTDVLLDHRRAGELPPDAKRYVSLVRAGSDQMSQLIEDLLSFSRLGRQEITRQPVDLNILCRDVLKEAEPEFRDRTVETHIEPLPEVFADPALLRVVFVNLLSNALKYSRPRNPAVITVGISKIPDETGPVFFVRDNGVGFDMANTEKLFGVFQRLHHAHEFEGTGVGLATVRRVIERHGGRIWAEAAPDEGATFYFTLPNA
jgi:signal transduction histidine kinase